MAYRGSAFTSTFAPPMPGQGGGAPSSYATGAPGAPAPSANNVSAQACNCGAQDYEPSSPCYEQCGGGNSGGGGTGGGTAQCPEGTPGGYADCCPPGPNGQRVWRPDTKTCEYEDDRQKAGEDTCRDQPPVCPPGQVTYCDFTTATHKCVVGGGGGGGGGMGAMGTYGAPPMPTDPALDQAAEIWKVIKKRLHAPSRYTPQVMQSLAGETKFNSEMQANRLTEQANADAASRGILRSGPAHADIVDIRQGVSGQNIQGWNSILRAKIDADYQDKTQAIKEGMDWINSLRDYIARSYATEAQKQAAMANVMLGYARLQQELNMLREQYAQQINLVLLNNQLNQ